jgi:8-oxo-dGTP diphosphatase
MGQEDQGVFASHGRYQVLARVLCFVTHGDEVLLLRGGSHKRTWAGRYNGVGGHLEPREDVRTALLREVKEETGLDVEDPRLRGVVHVDVDDPILGVLFFVFTASALGRQVVPSAEGSLEWFNLGDLPFTEMVEDLPVILPLVLAMGPADPPFFASYSYDTANRLVVSFSGGGELSKELP